MTRQEQILDIASQYAINETDGQNGGKAASKRGLLLSAFRDCATWADSHPRWIPVEEKKPNDGQVVFIHTKHGSVASVTYKDGVFNLNEVLEAINVTHWMPIVPPRKEADND